MKRPSSPRTVGSAKRPTPVGRLPAELDNAARLCASNDLQGSLNRAEIVRLAEIARRRALPILQPWSVQQQCEALGASVGPSWSTAMERWTDELGTGSPGLEWSPQDDEEWPAHGTTTYGPGPIYQEDLPPEMQREIMFRLAETDPRSAIGMASASRMQRAMLESIPGAALGTSIGLTGRPGAWTGTGYDYARALSAIGAGEGQTSAMLAEALCLMQAFARYVFSDGNTLQQRAPSYVRLHPEVEATDESPGGDALLPDRLGIIGQGQGDRVDPDTVRDWYLWTTIASDAEYAQAGDGSPLLASLMTGTGGTVHQNARDIDRIRDDIDTGVTNTVGPNRERQTDNVQTIGFVDPSTLADILTTLPPTARGQQAMREDVERWDYSGGLNAIVRNVLASPAAEAALRDYVDERIASHLAGPCARLTPETGLSLPRFTSLFDVALYVLPWPSGVVEIVASIRSPEIERMLAFAGAWPSVV